MDYVTWPPAGFLPTRAARGAFSFSNYGLRQTHEPSFELAIDDGPFEAMDAESLPRGYGGDRGAWSFFVPREAQQAGTTVRVRVAGFDDRIIEYEVKPVNCDQNP